MTTKQRDIVALGAACMPTRHLLKLACVHPEELSAADEALSLLGSARTSACGRCAAAAPRAALELGRRAWMLPSPAGRRVRAPVDVAAICAPRFVDDRVTCLAIALDRRLTVAPRVEATIPEPGYVLRATLGVTRVVLAMNRRGQRAVPSAQDTALANIFVASLTSPATAASVQCFASGSSTPSQTTTGPAD